MKEHKLFIYLMIGMIILFICAAISTKSQHKNAYAGWCKLTGNPKQVTYEEWCGMVHMDIIKVEHEESD